jgi:hypothetical protein
LLPDTRELFMTGNPDLDSLTLFARAASVDGFCARHPHPFLAGEQRSALDDADPFATLGATAALGPLPEVRAPVIVTVIPVEKGSANPFKGMITIGRAANNDVVVEHPTVSKFHAFLRSSDDGAWQLVDAGSSNGTFLRLRRLDAQTPADVHDGDEIAFGRDARFRFYRPATLHALLRRERIDQAA